jgi:hypothetical protein
MIQCNLSKICKKAVLQVFGFGAGFLLVWHKMISHTFKIIVNRTYYLHLKK